MTEPERHAEYERLNDLLDKVLGIRTANICREEFPWLVSEETATLTEQDLLDCFERENGYPLRNDGRDDAEA